MKFTICQDAVIEWAATADVPDGLDSDGVIKWLERNRHEIECHAVTNTDYYDFVEDTITLEDE